MDVRFRRYNVIASFPDIGAARGAIEALEGHGVDGGAISLLGRQAAESDEPARAEAGEDEQLEVATRTGVKGAVAGAGAGGAVGFLAGLAAFGIPGVGPAIGGGIWAMVLGGSVAGAGVGLAANSYAHLKQSEAWEQTFAAVSEGQAVVGVHADQPAELERATKVLRAHHPQSLRWFDDEGNAVESPRGGTT